MDTKAAEKIKDFGDGLALRFSTVEDADRLAEFNAKIHGKDPIDAAGVATWTRDLLLKDHPTFQKGDFAIVEKTATGEIVSSMNLISQTWLYDGIPFGVGRPELVGTLPDYRNRGLVRAQFEALHALSRRRGELVQAIAGIPYFYRQFGYEMTVDLDGGRIGFPGSLPRLEEGVSEPFHIRPAVEPDIAFILRMLERGYQRSLLSCRWDKALLRHELLEKSRDSVTRLDMRIIETHEGRPVGFLAHPNFTFWGQQVLLMLFCYELDEGISYLAVTPTVLRYLWSTGQIYAAERSRTADALGLSLGLSHPAYVAAGNLLPVERKPYAFYMRVADLPAFIRVIAPALEKHLEESDFGGHTGDLKISFYRGGLRIALEEGRITSVDDWTPSGDEANAAFPGLTFLHILFGHRTLDEIRHMFVDCWANDATRALLGVMFPRKPSSVLMVA